MRTITQLVFCGCLSFVSLTGQCKDKFAIEAEGWLKDFAAQDTSLSVKKVKYNQLGHKHKTYTLEYLQYISDETALEARLIYSRHRTNDGSVSQTIASQSYVVGSWWDYQGARVGLTAQQDLEHRISGSFDLSLQLPRRQIVGMHVELASDDERQLRLSANRVKFSQSRDGAYDFNGSIDNQLAIAYRLSF